MFESIAFAMGTPQAGAQPAGGMGMLASFMPFILMFVIFWFLLIRPQQKRAKAHREMLENLKRGDKIFTQGGFIGKIVELNKDDLILECGTAKLCLSRAAIAGVITDKNEKKDKKERKEERREAKKEAAAAKEKQDAEKEAAAVKEKQDAEKKEPEDGASEPSQKQ